MRSLLIALSCFVPAALAVTYMVWFLSNRLKYSRKRQRRWRELVEFPCGFECSMRPWVRCRVSKIRCLKDATR
jgi:hypothetical protein